MSNIEASADTTGSPTEVWALLSDASTWSTWGAWSQVEVEGGGPQGPGSVRVLTKAPFHLRERVTQWVPDKRMGYELVDGMRVRGYRAVVSLEPGEAGGTRVHWRPTYEHAGPLTALVLRMAVRDACRRLARAASA